MTSNLRRKKGERGVQKVLISERKRILSKLNTSYSNLNPFITNLTRTIMPGSILSTCQQPSSASIYLPAPLQPLIHRKAAEHAGRQTPCCTRDAERDDVPVQRDVSY